MVLNFPARISDLVLESMQAVFSIATFFLDRQQFQAFGIQYEHQAVQEGHRRAKDEFTVYVGIAPLTFAHIYNKAAREVAKNILENAELQAFPDLFGIFLRFRQHPVEESGKRLAPEHQPPILKRIHLTDFRGKQRFFQIDLVVVGDLVAGSGRIQAPELAVSHDHPGRLASF